MPNQLYIPFKKTYLIPIREAVREHIFARYTDTHPDAYRWDIGQWERLRADTMSSVVYVDRVDAFIGYHAQLVFILTKLPPDIGLEISYAPVFNSTALPESFINLVYERAGVLFNLASLYSQLGASEDRSTPSGLKQAIKFYQSAAGALKFLAGSVVPQLHASLSPDDTNPLEFTEHFIRGLENLMLAQAQECVWQKAVMDNYKNGLISKLAAKVSSFYGSAVTQARDSSIRHIFPSSWLAHMETKFLHFQAAAQYRKSLEDLEANKYGHEIARLGEARSIAKQGSDTARRGGVASPVQQDIKSLLDMVEKSISRAERDNDLIYHQDVPPTSALPAIAEVAMVQPLIDPELQDPKAAVGNDVIFGELLGWPARLAIDIYKDRRQNWITDEIKERVQKLDNGAARTLDSLNLPAALDVLDQPVGLPPSLVTKLAEVRQDCGPDRVETAIRDVQMLANHDAALLDEAMDILDQEADEDELFRENLPQPALERLPSHEANKDLIEKEKRYRAVLQQAKESDGLVRQKWEEWEDNITQLTWSESELEISIPSSNVLQAMSGTDPSRTHARSLRMFLEKLDDQVKARADIVARVDRLAASDDITSRILKAASAMEQWVNVQPAMFEDILDSELSKYDRFRVQLEESATKQAELLDAVKERHAEFVHTRQEDDSMKAREHALQSLDLAYHKYKEVVQNLEEGQKFYNDFAVILSQFRDMCKNWVNMRRQGMTTLKKALQTLYITEPTSSGTRSRGSTDNPPHSQPEQAVEVRGLEESTAPPRPVPVEDVRAAAFDLPPPDSDEWETMAVPPAPRAHNAQTPQKRTVRSGRQ